MKILFIIHNKQFIGGGDYAQFKFAEALSVLGNEVTVFAANKNEFMKDIPANNNLEIIYWKELPELIRGTGKINRLWGNIFQKIIIENHIKRQYEKYDFIIGYLRESAISAVELGKKFGIHTANFVFESPPWMLEKLGARFEKEYTGRFKKSWEKTRKAYRNSDLLFPNSNIARKRCSDWIGKKVEEPIYPGVDLKEECNNKIIPNNQIIYVGRLSAYKNVDHIIKALNEIKDPPALAIVGSGEEENFLKSLAKKLKVDVKFLGKLTDKEKWDEICRSLFMVFPSSFEGFGMPPAEALLLGTYCICSDIPVLKEIYQDKVEYFKENDIDDLKQKIEYLLKNQKYCTKKGHAGAKYIKEHYSWQTSAKKLEKILKKHLK